MTAKAAATPRPKKASGMFREAESFSSFSVNDLKKAKEFYGQTLGLTSRRREHRKDSNFIQTTTRFSCIRNRTIPRHLSRFLISQ